jgi:acetyl esterase/lipase
LWLAARRSPAARSPGPLIPSGSPLLAADPLPIDAVVSLGGLPDLELAATPPGSGCGTEVVEKLVGPPTLSSRNVYADTSVPRLAPLGARQVLINGLQDRIIPTAFAEDYAGKMRAAGDRVKVRMIDRTGHVELIAPETAAWAAAVEEIEAALGRKR